MKATYYNENDEEKAEWLRELIRRGIVAQGEVDTRSIAQVWPEDLDGFAQCHFFAGIGVWSYALRLAGWPDDRPVWTGSCPCPSFSAAGKGAGFDDPRHLWPDWARLIRKCRPATLFGEQADDAIGYGWLDLVQTDLEREDYAVGKAVLGACSVGAPHIRQRLYFVGHSTRERQSLWHGESSRKFQREALPAELRPRDAHGLGDADSERCGEAGVRERQFRTSGNGANHGLADSDRRGQSVRREPQAQHDGELGGNPVCGLGNADSPASEQHGGEVSRSQAQSGGEWFGNGHQRDGHSGAGFVNGFWRDADWVLRKRWNSDDWEWCPAQPNPQPMVDGSAESLGRLCESRVKEIEEEISEAAQRHQADPRKAVHDLWQALSEDAVRIWASGGLRQVYDAPVLLAFLRQLTDQGWTFSESIPFTSKEAAEKGVRGVRQQEQTACTSRGRRLDEQRPGESANSVHFLSSILARHAQEAWSEAFYVYAGTSFPLAVGMKNRVLKLRGYGDSIVPQVAAAFIEASTPTAARAAD